MKLLIPLGLLGLVSIAALILIYILKPKYQEKKVASTYIWKLSLKYAKRKVPLAWLQSSLLFIIQLLILAIIAFSMAAPQFVLATKNGEKIVVLDASASMLAEDGGKTRFERAKDEISTLVDKTVPSYKISLIIAGDKPSVAVRRSDSETYIKQKLFEAECSLSGTDIPYAMELAEGLLEENSGAEVYLYTDCDYGNSGKVKVVNMSSSEWNASVLNFTAKREKGRMVFTAEVGSYSRAAEIAVGLKVDGKSQMPKLAACGKDEVVQVVWDNLDISTYESAEVHLSADDSFTLDNDFYIYSDTNESFKVQLVAKDSDIGFLSTALRSTEKCRLTTITYFSGDEEGSTVTEKFSGFDLYIYDNYAPKEIPRDGTVWFINPPSNLPSSLGLTLSSKRKSSFRLSASGSNSETAKSILKSIDPTRVKVTEFTPVTAYAGYESILNIGNDPALLVKNDNGYKTVVIPFDLHMSDLPIVPQFPLFINALCDYSMAYTLEKSLFEVGETITINAKADAEYISVTTERGEQTFTTFPVEITADSVGVYKIKQQTASGREVDGTLFVCVNKNESVFGKTEGELVNPMAPFGSGTDSSVANNTIDITVYLLAAIFVLVCVEWGLQYREQY